MQLAAGRSQRNAEVSEKYTTTQLTFPIKLTQLGIFIYETEAPG